MCPYTTPFKEDDLGHIQIFQRIVYLIFQFYIDQYLSIMEYRSIVCPIDDSKLSEKAEETAAYLSKLSSARLILLHVVEKWYKSLYMATDSRDWNKLHNKWLDEGRDLLKREEEKLRKVGVINIETALRDGDAVYEIVALATERRSDLIVMATHHYTTVGKIFMGSITDRVTKIAPCPVLWIFE